jgi:hypothetical protein
MIGAFTAQDPSVGIFWVVETGQGEARLLTAGCALETAEPYGDFLTFAGGHHTIWESWRKIKDPNAALRALVRSFEYEEWPRGRIVFDQKRKGFTLYADRKLMSAATIAKIQALFALPPDKTIVETDFHYQSPETPGPLP